MQKNSRQKKDRFSRDENRRPARERSGSGEARDGRDEIPKGAGIIAGRNAVSEALKAGRPISALYVLRGEKTGPVVPIIAKAREKNIPVKEADRTKLQYLCGGAVHQGVVAVAAAKDFSSLEDVFALAEERGEPPFIVICDEIEDPHNLGAIIRSAECAGAHGVIVPRHRGVGLTYAVGKASAGAVEYLPVVQAQNLTSTIKELKDKGLWIYAADMDGQPWCETDLSGPLALVIGSEGKGVGRLVKENCDVTVSLPIKGHINSLNASVAAGVLCYEVCRQRSGSQGRQPKG